MATWNYVNIGSGNGLLPDGTKPLPEPMLTYNRWGPMPFILRRCEDTNQENKIENYGFKMASRSPRGQWVKSYKLGHYLSYSVTRFSVHNDWVEKYHTGFINNDFMKIDKRQINKTYYPIIWIMYYQFYAITLVVTSPDFAIIAIPRLVSPW